MEAHAHDNTAPTYEEGLRKEMEIGVENIRRMFRQQMLVEAERRGEPLPKAKKRLGDDPATADIARMLNCSVEELLHNFGQTELFVVPEGYSQQDSARLMEEIIQEVMAMAFGFAHGAFGKDELGGVKNHVGELAAPEDERLKVSVDDTPPNGLRLTSGLRDRRPQAAVRLGSKPKS